MTPTTNSGSTGALRRKPWHRTVRTGSLVLVLATVGLALGGPGGSDVEIPVSSFSGAGGSHSIVLASGDPFDVDFSVGLAMGAEGTATGDYSLSSGFQVQREAAEEGSGPVGTPFRRGDVNGDALFNIADPVSALAFLFTGGSISCDDAADCNDDGTVNIADPVSALAALFSGGSFPPAPGSDNCGPDPTDDTLECDSYNSC